jgi:hypothetical protein
LAATFGPLQSRRQTCSGRFSSLTCNSSRCGGQLSRPRGAFAFLVHVDEFQTFSSEAFASLLSEARKFATHFTLANQYTDQLSHAVRAAVIGNAGSLVVFRVGNRDAELLAPERPIERGMLPDQEPFTAWLRRSAGSDRVTIEPRLYEPIGSAEAIQAQSRRGSEGRKTLSSGILMPNQVDRLVAYANIIPL